MEQILSGQADIPRPHGEDQVPRLGQLPEPGGESLQGGVILAARDLRAQVPGRDAKGVVLPGGEDLGQKGDVGDSWR